MLTCLQVGIIYGSFEEFVKVIRKGLVDKRVGGGLNLVRAEIDRSADDARIAREVDALMNLRIDAGIDQGDPLSVRERNGCGVWIDRVFGVEGTRRVRRRDPEVAGDGRRTGLSEGGADGNVITVKVGRVVPEDRVIDRRHAGARLESRPIVIDERRVDKCQRNGSRR